MNGRTDSRTYVYGQSRDNHNFQFDGLPSIEVHLVTFYRLLLSIFAPGLRGTLYMSVKSVILLHNEPWECSNPVHCFQGPVRVIPAFSLPTTEITNPH